jgi:glucose-1-phosphate thymidylyltransferase
MIDSGQPVAAVETEGEWSDLIYPWDILSVSGSVVSRVRTCISGTVESNVCIRGRMNIGEDCVVRPSSCIVGPAMVGASCVIGPDVTISGPASIGDNTVIEPFTYISNSVIGSNVHIGPGAVIQDSVIDDGTFIGARFTVVSGEADIRIGSEYHHRSIGAMIGGGCRLGAGVTVQPGTIVGNYCQVKDIKVLSGDIPDKSLVV